MSVAEVGTAVGGMTVTVGTFVKTVMVSAIDNMLVNVVPPCKTRAVHSMFVCPTCRPLMLNVKAVPLVVALLPLLPASATMNTPFCGPLIAETVSAPNRLAIVMLLDSIRVGLYVQVNSALVYPVPGTLFKLTVMRPVFPATRFLGVATVQTNGTVGMAVVVGVGTNVLVGGAGVTVATDVLVGTRVSVATGVSVGTTIPVAVGVKVGRGVSVAVDVLVGTRVVVGEGVTVAPAVVSLCKIIL